MSKKICVVTGSRAEYGLLKPLMALIKKDTKLELQLVVTGMHLSSEFGSTYKEILKDGFKIDKKVDISLTGDTPESVANSTGLAISRLARAYKTLDPDIVVLLGDRFEIFGAAAAALISRKIIAHIHGGELTEGAIDDAFRHSITKMSHLHFTSTEEYRKRVIQLGEDPKYVYNVGALGVDNIKKIKLLTKKQLEEQLGFVFGEKNLLVTYHPVTLEDDNGIRGFKSLLDALDRTEDTKLIFTKSNADPGGRKINRMMERYVSKNPHKAVLFRSLGQLNYLSVMKYVDAVVGNSSSGIIEAPSFKIGTINIGDRQKGRICAENTLNCSPYRDPIEIALNKLYKVSFQKLLRTVVNPYGKGDASKKIINELKKNGTNNAKKFFHDIVVKK